MKSHKYIFNLFFVSIFGVLTFIWNISSSKNTLFFPAISSEVETDKEYVYIDSPDTDLPYPLEDSYDPSDNSNGQIDLNDPDNINQTIEYDPETGTYEIKKQAGNVDVRNPSQMDFDDYLQYDMDKSLQDYWQKKIDEENQLYSPSAPELDLGEGIVKDGAFGCPGGAEVISIKPQGSAELKFGINTSKVDNPQIPVKNRRFFSFDFDQNIQLGVTGSICDKLNLGLNYNTEAQFDFDNQMKIGYEGDEDEIIQVIEAGNISFGVPNSLINGSQSLFGLKSKLKFGRLTVSTVLSQQKGERKEIQISGGAKVQQFEVKADEYESNKHYFLNFYHRDNFDNAMATLPNASSQVRITRMEVWVTNKINDFDETRNIVGFSDLGEYSVHQGSPGPGSVVSGLPDNNANGLYSFLTNPSVSPAVRNISTVSGYLEGQAGSPGPFQQGVHFEKLENARMLSAQEYSYNSVLGYISLNQQLNNDEVLAVAYQYTYQGQTFQVGEFSTDGIAGTDALFLKLLKGTITNPQFKVWDLMMKNIYSIGAYQVSPENFKLDVWYNNPKTSVDINYIPQTGVDDKLLVQLIGLDRLNQQQYPQPDGVFDFVPLTVSDNKVTNGGTIDTKSGRIIFTKVEPFGIALEQALLANGVNSSVAQTVVFHQLYDSTKIRAQQFPTLNRFTLKGSYESSVSSEISLNAFNIPEGSVVITAGGVRLIENQDYTVDYNLGRVKIINNGILQSGTPIKISLESNSLFGINQKNLMGTHLDYRVSKNFNLGATLLRLSEKPLTQKVNLGDEPIRNTMVGFNGDFQTEAPFLTKLVDAIPLINTKEKSSITVNAEYAQLIPGVNPVVNGNSYIDDFEGAQSTIDIRAFNTWSIASVPQGQPNLFPEASQNGLQTGFNRAKLAWYVVDPTIFYGLGNNGNLNAVPTYLEDDSIQNNHLMRQVFENEVFPNRTLAQGTPQNIAMFDMAYYPSERGPYNFDTDPSVNSFGLDNNGSLINPGSRWGGIMRQLTTNDFEAANVEYIQFWMMDPFQEGVVSNSEGDPASNEDSRNTTGGDLYFNLGNVSEDILKDGSKSFENGLTTDGTFDPATMKETVWGRVPTTQSIVNAFDNNIDARIFQDVGLDGLSSNDEQDFFADYINWVNNVSGLSASAKARINSDPSGDDYVFFRDDNYDAAQLNILERYKKYNGLEGNSPSTEYSATLNNDGYTTSKTTLPDIEDINFDNNLSETESYYQYRVSMRPQDMVVGKNYITDRITTTVEGKDVYWYQFKIPVREPSSVVNGMQNLRSVRFIRMFMKQFSQPVVLRFARLELIRGEWRRYDQPLVEDGEFIQTDPSGSIFNIGAVNVEENSSRIPINYIIPPNIQRENNFNTVQQNVFLNEQSLTLEVCNLKDGVSRAAFRNVELDMIQYKRLQMFVHAESADENLDPVADNDLTLFVRLGSDFEQNYYEYEMPMKVSQWGSNTDLEVWPEENNIDIIFEELKQLKIERNNSAASLLSIYSKPTNDYPDRIIKVVGNPNLQGLKTIMVGVRNPHKDQVNPWKPDDGKEKCAEIWINELRLTDFNNQGGWATQSRVQANLADFANVAVAGSYSTPGFGSIEKGVNERQRETIQQVDLSTNVQLGKFFGDKLGVSLPMYYGFSEGVTTPQFDPLNPDLLLEFSLQEMPEEERQKRLSAAQTFITRRSLNFTNVSINPAGKKKSYPWDINNFNFSYSYSENLSRDINTEYNVLREYNGGLGYSYQSKAKPWSPFKKMKIFRNKWFGLVRDFNVGLVPNQLGFRTNIDRTYNERKIRNNYGDALIIPQFNKTFNWTRNYDLMWNLTENLKFDFKANNLGIIGEPADAKVDKDLYPEDFQMVKDSVMKSIQSLGETMQYGHTSNLTYTWPTRKIPVLEFVNLSTRVSTSYDWQRAPFGLDSLGSLIQNSRNVSWNANLNMSTLYNKIPYFKKVEQKSRRAASNRSRKSNKKDDKSKLEDGENKRDEKEKDSKSSRSSRNASMNPVDYVAQLIMSLKTVSMTLSTNDGIMLPGYNNSTQYLGMSPGFSAPGFGFVSGGQQARDIFGRPTGNDFAQFAADNDWLVGGPSRFITNQHTVNHGQTFNGRASIEPFRGVRIELTADRNFAENFTENFMWDTMGQYQHLNNITTGTYSTSINTFRTAFKGDNKEDFNSEIFNNLLTLRQQYSDLFADDNANSNGLDTNSFRDGYGRTQQDVILSSFLSAYTGKGVDSKFTKPFDMMPAVNWRININNLSRIKALKKIFRSIVISHAYRSNFSIASFTTNLESQQDANGDLVARDQAGNFISGKQILSVAISEQFAPLFKIDATLNNSLIAKFEYKSDRSIALSLTNNQITEVKGKEFVIGSGYRFKNVKFPIKFGNKNPVSDMNVRLDISYRNNKTIIRKIIEEQNNITAGQEFVSIKASADYVINQRFNLRFYFDRVMTNPFVSTAFPTSNTNAGISVRITLF